MTWSTRAAIALLVIAQGLVGCGNDNRLPLAPSTGTQAPPGPFANPPRYTVTASAIKVAPGALLSVSWTASTAGARDWIGLFSLGAPLCDHGWSEGTGGATAGTLTLTAPTQQGQYEFRYFPNNGCEPAAHSDPVTVTSAD